MSKPTALKFPGKADAYLEWAAHTNFGQFAVGSHGVGLLLRQANNTFFTRTLPVKELDEALREKSIPRAELATAVARDADKSNIQWGSTGVGHNAPLFLGVIDDGCPFARRGLKDAKEKHSRVMALWDQNHASTSPEWLGYGTLWFSKKIGLTPPKDSKEFPSASDPDEAYRQTGMKSLQRRVTHGAHVLDLLAGPIPPKARVSASRLVLEGGDGSAELPPSFTHSEDAASQAPIAFVQLPQDAIDDPTGRWLGRYVLDGLDFLIVTAMQWWGKPKQLFAESDTSRKLVVNISWGPQTGPHDGSSLLERAMDQRVKECEKQGIELLIVLPAGNTFSARAHAQFPLSAGCKQLDWHVMPDSKTPQFLELWWPNKTTSAKCTIVAPDGSSVQVDGPGIYAVDGQKSWGVTCVKHEERLMALVAVGSTQLTLGAPHGVWKLHFDAQGKTADLVHAYVARNSSNMGGRRRGKDGYLTCDTDKVVTGEGTLNGIATGEHTVVAAGYVLSRADEDKAPASYSSSGPGANANSKNPDWALPTDESPVVHGILASGVREGSVVRLVGTSTAAPQLARKLANGEKLGNEQARSQRGPRLGQGRLPLKKEEIS